MKALIFGAGGQDGYYLSELLKQKNIDVISANNTGSDFIVGDVADYKFVSELIKTQKPDYIFDFAAISSVAHEYLFQNHEIIATGTLNILESARLYCPASKVFLSGSAMQFKNIGEPINERTPFEASSPYSIARIQSVYAARYYRSKFALNVYVGYFFNHDSPLRTESHINKKITEAVKRIAGGSRETVEIGDLEVKKEFNFAGDVVEAVWLLVNQNSVFEAVIGCGEAHSIKDFVEACFKIIGKDWRDHVRVREDFISDYRILVSDPSLIKSLGWKPTVDMDGLVDLMMAK